MEEDKSKMTRKKEEQYLDDINNSYFFVNDINRTMRTMSHVKNAAENSSTKEKTVGYVFLVVFIGLMLGIVVCVFLGKVIIAAVLGGVGILMCVIAYVVVRQKGRTAVAEDNIDYSQPCLQGIVNSCMLSSENEIGMGLGSVTVFNKVKGVIYKVKVQVGDKELVTYGKRFYDKGEPIKLYHHKTKKDVYIIAPENEESIENNENIG